MLSTRISYVVWEIKYDLYTLWNLYIQTYCIIFIILQFYVICISKFPLQLFAIGIIWQALSFCKIDCLVVFLVKYTLIIGEVFL